MRKARICGHVVKISASPMIAAALMLAASASTTHAAQKTWSGGVSSDFEDGANWVGGVAPVDDASTDVAVFDGAATYQPSLTKSRSVASLLFKTSGWTLGGSSYTLTKGSYTGNAIEMQAAGTVTLEPSLHTADWFGVKVPAGSKLIMNGTVSTTADGLVAYTGGGTVRLAGSQTNTLPGGMYTGSNQLTWELAKTSGAQALPGAMITNGSTYRWFGDGQITSGTQGSFRGSGTYDLNGFNQTFSQFTVPANAAANTSATITTGAGVATLSYTTPLQVDRTDMAAAMSVSGNVKFTGSQSNIAIKRNTALTYDLDVAANINSSNANLKLDGGGIARFSSLTGNGYAKNTSITNGTTLLIANTSGSATGTGTVTVNTNGILGGNGIIVPGSGNSVTISSTGHLAPGNSIGTVTITGDANLQSGGAFDFELGDSGASDLLNVANLTLAGDLNLTQMIATTPSGTYVLANYSGTLSGTFANVSGIPLGYQLNYGDGSNDQITLTVPEPASVISLMGVGGMALLRRRKRRT